MKIIPEEHWEEITDLFGDWFSREISRGTVTDIVITSEGNVFLHEGNKVRSGETGIPPMAIDMAIRLFADSQDINMQEANNMLACTVLWNNILLRIQGFKPPEVTSPSIIIRIANQSNQFTLDDFSSSIGKKDILRLKKFVKEKKTIMVAGATGSGKTTLVKALIEEIPKDERIIIIEDTPELFPSHKNILQIRTSFQVTTRQAVRATMRSAPHRVLVGEVRDGAAYELLKVCVTGHPGGLFTIHAGSIEESFMRLDHLALEVCQGSQKELIRQAIDVAIFIKLEPSGKRSIEINEK